ncbi:MAG: type VI secretion system baseplate subunit TssE [Planctomycetes bacterium]|nr:type VI secretion system baseplate subunit TssE [Planctomycetota bacterium]
MFRDRTLLERLSQARTRPARTMTEDPNALLKSVIRNLARILNSRQGQAPAQMDFGIPAPSEITQAFPDSVDRMQRIIRRCIEKYEPRLHSVNVIYVENEDDQLTLRFQVTAKVQASQQQHSVFFDTLVNSTGHVNLTS